MQSFKLNNKPEWYLAPDTCATQTALFITDTLIFYESIVMLRLEINTSMHTRSRADRKSLKTSHLLEDRVTQRSATSASGPREGAKNKGRSEARGPADIAPCRTTSSFFTIDARAAF